MKSFSKKFIKQLKSYSLLSGSILSSAIAARAQIVYHDVDPDIELYAYKDSISGAGDYLDLNNDGIAEFFFFIATSGTNTAEPIFFPNMEMGVKGKSSLGMEVFAIDYYVYMAHKFSSGDPIPGNYTGFNQANTTANFVFIHNYSVDFMWGQEQDKFIGFKQTSANNEQNYGWIRLDVNTLNTDKEYNIVIKDFAYQTIPEIPILAGDTGLPNLVDSEPSTNKASIYPNPTSGILNVKLKEPFEGKFIVRDITGRTMMEGNIASKVLQQIDLTSLPGGMYHITMFNSSQSTALTVVKTK